MGISFGYLVGVQRRYHAGTTKCNEVSACFNWLLRAKTYSFSEDPKGLVRFCPRVGELGTPTPQKVRSHFRSWLNHIPQYPIKSPHDCYDWWYFGFIVPKHWGSSLLSPVPSTGWKASNFAHQNGLKRVVEPLEISDPSCDILWNFHTAMGHDPWRLSSLQTVRLLEGNPKMKRFWSHCRSRYINAMINPVAFWNQTNPIIISLKYKKCIYMLDYHGRNPNNIKQH